MPQEIQIKVLPHEVDDLMHLKRVAAHNLNIKIADIAHVHVRRKSLDARKKPIVYQLYVLVFKEGEDIELPLEQFDLKKVTDDKTCHIIGFGPAGIFAALQCLELGIKPIVIERGKAVEERLHDISKIHKKFEINKDSNYCFGEGGAGTYSDGKLYTRSNKRGNVKKVLQTFIDFGADSKIGVEAQPHIGTNKLPRIIASMRAKIIELGGEIHFNENLVDFVITKNKITKIVCASGNSYDCKNIILATGHSARNIFELLHSKEVQIEAKPFALGVRIEHSQSLIDKIQYKLDDRSKFLPPATYSLVTQAENKGVFSFCMCPGGVVAPSMTNPKEIVVNGWSSSARNGPYANSGMVVEVRANKWKQYEKHGALAALRFQEDIEQKAFNATNSLKAPAQRVEDFIHNKLSTDLPRTSYTPGLESRNLNDILPEFVSSALRQGLIDFGKKMRGYLTNEAVLIGVESRTSSPVRIPRDKKLLVHPEVQNLFPCGEGAGYAGGIVSAAIDGMRCAEAIGEL